jgi:hypothetical protein
MPMIIAQVELFSKIVSSNFARYGFQIRDQRREHWGMFSLQSDFSLHSPMLSSLASCSYAITDLERLTLREDKVDST